MDERGIYLGDGVYAAYDGYGIELTTNDGISVTNRIYLGPEVFQNLEEYVRRLRNELEANSRVL